MPEPSKYQLAQEAKSIVALAFRNGPIENVHAGKRCPTCSGDPAYSHVTDAEMKDIMKQAVDGVYELLLLKNDNPREYAIRIGFGSLYTTRWDDPVGVRSGKGAARYVESQREMMRELNRSAIIVTPQQPFLDWMHRIDPTSQALTLEEIAREPSVYLLEECETEEAFRRRLRKAAPAIFEDILDSWWTEESDWPEDRTYPSFRIWFTWQWYSMFADLSDIPMSERGG